MSPTTRTILDATVPAFPLTRAFTLRRTASLTPALSLSLTLTLMMGFAATARADGRKGDAKPAPSAKKQWVWLEKQGVWGYGSRIESGPHKGLWRIEPGSKVSPEDLAPASDPYGFAAILNQYRASAGLPPVAYDPDLASWAARNNAAQHHRGLGHHVNPNCHQNCAWNTPDAHSTAAEWLNSPGHRANMLAPGISSFGIAFGPGPYWTMNAR